MGMNQTKRWWTKPSGWAILGLFCLQIDFWMAQEWCSEVKHVAFMYVFIWPQELTSQICFLPENNKITQRPDAKIWRLLRKVICFYFYFFLDTCQSSKVSPANLNRNNLNDLSHADWQFFVFNLWSDLMFSIVNLCCSHYQEFNESFEQLRLISKSYLH